MFTLSREGVVLLEIAPGIDLQRDVLDMMGFRPIISAELKTIDSAVYRQGLLGLKDHFADLKARQARGRPC